MTDISQIGAEPVRLPSFRRRAGAMLIDNLIVYGAFMLPHIVYWNVLLETSDAAEDDFNALLDITLPLLVALWILYFWIGNSVGGTIGKRWLGLRTVSIVDQASNMGLAKGLLRVVVQVVGGLLLFAGWLLCLVSSKKQALHDMASGSTVIVRQRR